MTGHYTPEANATLAPPSHEHYEIAGYGIARSLARRLGESPIAETLQQTLNKEAEADKKLTSVAEGHVNVAAATTRCRRSHRSI